MNRELVVKLRINYADLMKNTEVPEEYVGEPEMKVLNELSSSLNKLANCREIEMTIEDEKTIPEHTEWDRSPKMGSKCSWSWTKR